MGSESIIITSGTGTGARAMPLESPGSDWPSARKPIGSTERIDDTYEPGGRQSPKLGESAIWEVGDPGVAAIHHYPIREDPRAQTALRAAMDALGVAIASLGGEEGDHTAIDSAMRAVSEAIRTLLAAVGDSPSEARRAWAESVTSWLDGIESGALDDSARAAALDALAEDLPRLMELDDPVDDGGSIRLYPVLPDMSGMSVEDQVMMLLFELMRRMDNDILAKARATSEAKRTVPGGAVGGEVATDVQMLELQQLQNRRNNMFATLCAIVNKYDESTRKVIDTMAR